MDLVDCPVVLLGGNMVAQLARIDMYTAWLLDPWMAAGG